MSSQIQRRVRATVRLEVMFDLPDEWNDKRIDALSEVRRDSDEGREFDEMLETMASNAILRGDVLDSEVDDWDYV